ncbi:MAG: DNA polymerase III subunit delta [Rhodoluna sp.]
MSKAKQMDWRNIAPHPVVFVSGPEEYFASRAIRSLREQLKRLDPALEIHEIEASEYQAGQLLNLTSPSLFAEPRLLIISGVERCSDELITDGLTYIENPTSDTTVVLRHTGSSVRGKKLVDALRLQSNCSEVACIALKGDGEKLSFVQAEFAQVGRKITQGGAKALLDAFSGDLAELAGACQQLLQDSADTISEEVVERYYGGRVETNTFKVLDAALAGQTGNALALLRHALASGADPVPMVAGISMKIRQLAKIYGNRNASAASIGMAPWQLDRAKKDLHGWSEDGLALVIQRLADADAAAKGAERDSVFTLEKLVSLIAAKGVVQ